MGLEERLIKVEEFAADVRHYTQILTEMLRRHEERLDEHDGMFREANQSISALADAQIRTEDELKQLTVAQKETNERLHNLITMVERLISRQNGDEQST